LRSAPISELDIVEGELPSRGKIASLDSRIWRSWQAFQPYAALDGKGEVFVTPSQSPDKRFFASSSGEVTNTPFLVIRTAQPQAITGSLYLPNSDYTSMVAVSPGAVIKENSGDPHAESLVHGVLALNTESELVRQRSSIATSIANINPLSWIGQSIALYVDADPLWAESAAIEDEKELEDFFEANGYRLPIAANFEVKNGLKLITFLAGMRTFIEQSAPGMTVWEKREYQEQAYVKVSPSAQAKSDNAWDNFCLYYAASGKSLILLINEDVLKRAIDRQMDRLEKKTAGEPVVRTGLPWLGENLCVTVDGKFLKLLLHGFSSAYHRRMQILSWGNLAVLNEWHARHSDQDPAEIHRQYWQRKLVCPGGGEYRWNETWQTMESTAYGHPGEPRRGASIPLALQSITSANFGQTFEENGLRARVQLTRETPSNAP